MTLNMFEGQHVRLRGPEPEDWVHFQRWALDTDAERFGWMVHPPRGSDAAKKFAQEASAGGDADSDNARFIIDTFDGTPVGHLNAHGCNRLHRRFEYGIAIDRQYWGKGFAEEALVLLLRFMFEERGYNKVNAWVYAFNERSQRMHEKFGMALEGRIREGHFSAGVFHDVLVFGMTASEFASRHPAGEV